MTRSAKIMTVCFVQVLGLWALGDSAYAVEGMVSYWTFDEGIGLIAGDSVGDNDGTLINGPVWTTGQVGGALSFDGINDYLAAPANNIPFGNSARTIVAWIKDNGGDGSIVQLGTGDCTGKMFALRKWAHMSNQLGFWGGCQDWYTTGFVIPNNQWAFIAVTYDGAGNVKLWLNDQSATHTIGTLNTLSSDVFIGAESTNNGASFREHCDGLIDEVAIWNRALTPEEIQQHYENGLSGYGYLPVDPKIIAINKINHAIAEKLEMLEGIDAGLEKEWAAYGALEELLDSGDYGDLKRGDIVTAKQKIHSAIQHQEQARNALEKSIEKLQDALAALGQ